ncbi:MAG: Membrane protein involved in the export of O-antigen and teichoic acid [Candidatus Woesebacteria bacterium GW2011_GWB1_39_12]|uniref:Membrane protein involved in the export of O-antigen and teichoic acid n=2 Tax=Candidatus Woeseibacteriota TaxID=1752722 RepID=A0A0G0MBN3_9BACT|nr:MAG: Membrane protein involved in the export of O-antigen and teichoic acid [Candidatus Woesebacteria bacterium GW2011_GWA1_39_12]KKR00465.1 MAG: Membrane protein involved in the export of O-antigen and teichoic acid [Candidatus Woesebacteria bacterium GW2011_GWB1_39_12]
MGYFKDYIKGLSWIGGLRFFTRIIAYLKTIILARILVPEQFGIFGIASLILAFLETLTETGINVFFIQGEGKIKKYVNSAWIVSLVRGLAISLLILLSSSYIANFFNSPESLNIIRLIALVPLIRGFINPAIVILKKDLLFKKEFIFRTSVFLIEGIVVIFLALTLKSAYSLVYGMIVGAFLEVILSFIFIKPLPKFSIEKEEVKKIIGRGKWVTLAQFSNLAFKEGDDVFVGRLLGTYALGIYQMAYKLATLPLTEVGEVVSEVTFPVYSKISGDIKRLKKAYFKVVASVIVLILPIGVILFFYPTQIVLVLLGEKWIGVANILKTLSLFGVLRAVDYTSLSLFLSIKKQEYVAVKNTVSFLIMIVLIIPLIFKYGLVGAAYSAFAGLLFSLPFTVYFLFKVFKSK